MKEVYCVPFGKETATEILFQKALSLLPKPSSYSILYIAPTPRKAKEATKIFTNLQEKKAFIPPRFLTLKQLAREIYFSFGEKIFLPDYLKPVFISFLSRERLPLSYSYHISNLLKDLKQSRLLENWVETKNLVRESFAPFPDEQQRIEKILEIIERYQIALSEKGLIDSEDLVKEATQRLEKEKRPPKGILIIDGFMDLTKLEEFFLATLIKKFKNVLALAYFDPAFPQLYSLPKEFLDFLQNEDFTVVNLPGDRPPRTTDHGFYVFPSREEEIEGIARIIKKSHIEGRLTISKTIVTFPDLSLYAPIVERVFTKFGIPFTIYPQRSLAASPIIIPVISLLQAVRDDYPRVPTTTCLTSPFFTKISEKTKEFVSFYSKKAGIIKGIDNWKSLAKTIHSFVLDERGKKKPPASIFRIQRDINFFLSVTQTLKKEKGKLSGYLKELEASLEKLGWMPPTFDYSEEESPPSVPLTEFLEDKREFLSLLQNLSYLGEMECSFSEFVEVLETSLRYNPIMPEREERGVKVLGLLETRGLYCQDIFFGGLCESSLPSPLQRDPFLSDGLRKKLGLLHLDRHQGWQKLHFYRVLNTSKNEPFLSYPRQEGDHLLLPSPFLEGNPLTLIKEDIIFTNEGKQVLEGRQAKEVIDLPFLKPIDFSSDSRIKKMLRKRLHSYIHVTDLEKIRRCPYIFYLENVLGLEITEETSFEIEAREWGELVHEVLEKLYADGEIPLAEIPKRIENILNALLAEKHLPPFWKDCAKRIFEKLLPDFIEEEKNLREKGFHPYKTEVKIKDKFLPGLFIYGKVDRIDQQGNFYLILDYKTGGQQIFPKDIAHGSHLQLPLYSYLLRKQSLPICGFGIYSLRERKVKWLAKTEEEAKAAEALAFNFGRDSILMALKGHFPSTPSNKDNCQNCHYKFLCRI